MKNPRLGFERTRRGYVKLEFVCTEQDAHSKFSL